MIATLPFVAAQPAGRPCRGREATRTLRRSPTLDAAEIARGGGVIPFGGAPVGGLHS